MSSLDDELALFDQEINSIVESTPDASSSSAAAAPSRPAMASPSASSFSGAAAFTPNLLLPPQLRNNAPVLAPPPAPPPAATIESKAQLYAPATIAKQREIIEERKEEILPTHTLAIPHDIELAALVRAKQRNDQNSILGQVQRGERKMKRFVRSAGGETWEDPSLAEWDPRDFRIFCGDLGNEVSDELLGKAFRKYPTFQKAKVVRDGKTNKSKGYGFVSFKSQEDYVRAMREMDGKYVGNRPVKLRKSNWKDRNAAVVKKKIKEKKKLGLM